MQNLSHDIEQYILSKLNDEEDNYVSLRRKDLAEFFGCVPSQINYVLRSRFSPEQGYIIESRRGEHGYIKIVRIECITPQQRAKHTDDIIGSAITFREAVRLLEHLEDRGFITQREHLIMEIALRHSKAAHDDDRMIASMMKSMLRGLSLIDEEGEE